MLHNSKSTFWSILPFAVVGQHTWRRNCHAKYSVSCFIMLDRITLENKSKYLTRISICLVVLDLWPKIRQKRKFSIFSRPQYTKMRQKYESRHEINPWDLLFIMHFFYMSGIFSSLISSSTVRSLPISSPLTRSLF